MKVELVAVGDELLTGTVTDTNSAWLGRRLSAAGLDASGMYVVGDDPAGDPGRGLRCAGPGRRGGDHRRPRTDQRRRDRGGAAPLAASSTPDRLPNPVGTAAGLRIEAAGGVVYVLPGVPDEMTAMVEETVLPGLRERAGHPVPVLTRTLYVALLPEEEVADRLAPLERALGAADPPVRVSYLAGPGELRVRLTTAAPSHDEAAARLAPWLNDAADLIGDAACGVDEPLPDTVLRLLRETGGDLAVAESLTGGMVGAALTAVPGSSTVFVGGVVAYATELKTRLLGVDAGLLAERGAVDAEVARLMADGVRNRLGAAYGVATTGVAGPDFQDGFPPGTVHVAVAWEGGYTTASPRLRGDRERVRRLSVVHALDLLRRTLAKSSGDRMEVGK